MGPKLQYPRDFFHFFLSLDALNPCTLCKMQQLRYPSYVPDAWNTNKLKKILHLVSYVKFAPIHHHTIPHPTYFFFFHEHLVNA